MQNPLAGSNEGKWLVVWKWADKSPKQRLNWKHHKNYLASTCTEDFIDWKKTHSLIPVTISFTNKGITLPCIWQNAVCSSHERSLAIIPSHRESWTTHQQNIKYHWADCQTQQSDINVLSVCVYNYIFQNIVSPHQSTGPQNLPLASISAESLHGANRMTLWSYWTEGGCPAGSHNPRLGYGTGKRWTTKRKLRIFLIDLDLYILFSCPGSLLLGKVQQFENV